MTQLRTDSVAEDLRLIAELWPSLAESRIPGTPMPRREPTISPEARAELDHQARIEWIERSELAPGEHPDAARPEVLDLMASILCDACAISDELAQDAGVERLDPPSSAFADARPYLDHAAKLLPDASDDLVKWAAGIASEMRREISDALGLAHDGQLLRVVCPWCNGGWFGSRTLRVRVLPGDLVAIICESGICTPPDGDVGTWWRGRPAWPLHLWPWLSKRIQTAEKRERIGA